MIASTLRLTADDFAAYRPDWLHATASRRAELRRRATAWATDLAERLAAFDIFVRLLEEVPKRGAAQGGSTARTGASCLSIVLVREEEERGSLERASAFLELRLDTERIEVNLRVRAGKDLDEIRRMLGDSAGASELVGAVRSLPEPFTFGLPSGLGTPCTVATRETIRQLVDRVSRGEGMLRIGWTLSREVALAHKGILDEQLGDALTALAFVYRLIARAPEQRDLPVFAKGAKVRILGGPFAGKFGIVHDLDGRGSARIMLGLLSARVALDSLAPAGEGRERPALKSSHLRLSSGRGDRAAAPRTASRPKSARSSNRPPSK